MIRIAFALCLIAAPALAADPTFTKDEAQAAYMLGKADQMREAIAAMPAAKSFVQKMAPQPAAQPPQPQKKP